MKKTRVQKSHATVPLSRSSNFYFLGLIVIGAFLDGMFFSTGCFATWSLCDGMFCYCLDPPWIWPDSHFKLCRCVENKVCPENICGSNANCTQMSYRAIQCVCNDGGQHPYCKKVRLTTAEVNYLIAKRSGQQSWRSTSLLPKGQVSNHGGQHPYCKKVWSTTVEVNILSAKRSGQQLRRSISLLQNGQVNIFGGQLPYCK